MYSLRYLLWAIFSVLFCWQMIIYFSSPPTYILPSPYDVIKAFSENFGLIYGHAVITMTEVILGLIIGILLGFITALFLEASNFARLTIRPILIFSQSLPVFAIAPVLVLWFGYGMGSKVVMAVLIIFFPVTSAFHDGLSQTSKKFLDLAKTMRGKSSRILLYIKIPHSVPSLCSGIRLASVYAPIGAIIGEWVGSSQGLGYLMILANGRVKTDLMFASLFTLGILSILLYGLINFCLNAVAYRYQYR